MTGKKLLTRETYIRNLPYSALKYITVQLDSDGQWRNLIVHIPKKLNQLGHLGSDGFEERYSFWQVKRFADNGSKPGGSASMSILQDWGTQNAKVEHLVQLLIQAKFFALADFLLVKQLGEEPCSRFKPQEEDFESTSCTAVTDHLPSPPNINDVSSNINKIENCPKEPKHKEKVFDIGFPRKQGAIPVMSSDRPSTQDILRNECSSSSVQCDNIDSFESGEKSTELEGGFSVVPPPSSVPFKPGRNLKTKQTLSSDELTPSEMFNLEEKIREIEGVNGTFPPTKSPSDTDPVCKKNTDPVKKVDEHVFASERMPYMDLCRYTNNFSDNKVIGCGGFGQVFLGSLPNEYKVAIKQLKQERDHEHAGLLEKQFETELQMLSKLRHVNIVLLLGYCIDGPRKCLVYEYMVNGSLEDRLCCHRRTPPLEWKLRIKIIQGTAEGIAFLNNQKIVHRDIKSANVLLNEDFIPKVGDFATVRAAPSGDGSTVADTLQVIGTSAYMAPEAIRFDVSAKLDSFAFGVVLLEILTGLPPNDRKREDADLWSHVQENCDDDITHLLDPKSGHWDVRIANAIFNIAKRCLEDRKKVRVLVSAIVPELHSLLL